MSELCVTFFKEQETLLYEPESEEENYFFQDFSEESSKNTKKKKRTIVHRVEDEPKKMFDLSSFAKDLHDNRLSVIQPRQSTIIMTEEDEKQLETLLQQRKQMGSSESLLVIRQPSPLPSIERKPSRHETIKEEEEEQIVPQLSNHHSAANSVSSTISTVSSHIIQEEDGMSEKIGTQKKITSFLYYFIDLLIEIDDPVEINIDPSSSSSPPRPPTITPQQEIPSPIAPPSLPPPPIPSLAATAATTTTTTTTTKTQPDLDLKSSKSTSSIQSNIKRSTSTTSNTIIKTPLNRKKSVLQEEAKSPRKSISMDNLKAIDIKPVKSPSRSLFGSLRQVSRSKTTSSGGHSSAFKGLVRNMSTSHKPTHGGMSRAAMAVIQHEQQQEKEPKRATSRLISQLISKAARHRNSNTSTKIVNKKENNTNRAQVVRRTIIYVQPDSLHDLLKNGGEGTKIASSRVSDGSLSPDDETVRSKEYVTATKVVRQTSVRKRVVNNPEDDKKRWQLKSMDEHDLAVPAKEEYMEGLELREMSDGSVIWGIVKQQGNRKSFFAPDNMYVEEDELPPPIPKRSPKRQVLADNDTDIYYSNEITLPNLLKMMEQQETHPGDELSVDDQLDEMMRILTSQQ